MGALVRDALFEQTDFVDELAACVRKELRLNDKNRVFVSGHRELKLLPDLVL